MKANELMIGDWIKGESNIVARVIEIKEYLIRIDAGMGRGVFEPKELFPIPITPKILEKNGFENIGDDTYQLEEKPCWFWIDFFKHTYGCEYDTSTYEYEDDEHRLKLYGIPSVHELQHALRLCGIEKEIIV